MVAGAAGTPPAVISTAGISGLHIAAAHGEHGTAAVSAFQKACIHIVVFFHPTVVALGALFPEGPGGGEGAVVNDGRMVVLDDHIVPGVQLDVRSVDFSPGVFPRPEGADIKIVVQNPLNGDNAPIGLCPDFIVLPHGVLSLLFRHPRRGDSLFRQMVGDALIAPAFLVVEPENPPHHIRLRGDRFKFLPQIHDVAVGSGADPLSVLLPPPDDTANLFAGVRDGHLVDEELKLDFQPIVIVGIVDVVSDGNDPHPCIPQILQLHKPPGVAPGETGKVLHHQNVDFMGHHVPAHPLVVLPGLKGIAAAIPVLIEGQPGAGELPMDKVRNDRFLIFDGGVVLILDVVILKGNPGIPRNIKNLCQCCHILLRCFYSHCTMGRCRWLPVFPGRAASFSRCTSASASLRRL